MHDAQGAARLESFMMDHGIKPAELARAARISRQHLLRLRKGSMTPTLRMIVKIANGCGALLGRIVSPSELFRGLA